MAKVRGPLLSKFCSGSIGDRLTFSVRKSGQQARFQRAQKIKSLTWKQADNQTLYRLIYSYYSIFPEFLRDFLNSLVNTLGLSMTGWNAYFKIASDNPKDALGLSAYWSMNRSLNQTILDLSKNGNTGRLKPYFLINSPIYSKSKNSKMFYSLYFDGFDDYVDVSSSSDLDIGDSFSISVWIKTSNTSLNTILHRGSSGLDTGYSISVASGEPSNNSFSIEGVSDFKWGPYPGDGKWHHVVFVYDSIYSKMIVYVDGEFVQEKTVSGTPTGFYNQDLYIGKAKNGSYPFSGNIDELGIYNRVLSFKEVKILHNVFV